MTTKFPLCAFLMELTLQLEKRQLPLKLRWAPREQNVEADALTNEVFTSFDPHKRISITEDGLDFEMLDSLLIKGAELFEASPEERAELKRQAAQVRPSKLAKSKRMKAADPW